jgi:hypothetical protein
MNRTGDRPYERSDDRPYDNQMCSHSTARAQH